METLRLGIIGLGGRGQGIMESIHCKMDGVKVVHVCDLYQDRVDASIATVEKLNGHTPKGSLDYMEVINDPEVDVVIIMSAWENHIEASIAAMEAGKHVGCEVGGAYSIEDCWRLIRTYEKTGNHCMLLENCCFGKAELTTLRMVRDGIFGKIVHCEGGYRHDLRGEVARGDVNRHYRLRNYMNRNCENYPTHELGPIAKVLDINRGNRMISLSSFASGAWGLNEYARQCDDVNPALRDYPFAQGDIVVTNIKCAHGELITLTLDTTLPRHYSRGFTVRGTKGSYTEDKRSFFIDSLGESGNEEYFNQDEYFKKYLHPIWERYIVSGVKGGHEGMDWLEYEAFFHAIRNGEQYPIDTYDMATWMAVTPLSEKSIALGGAPVEFPDFTNGKWTHRSDGNFGIYSLEK